MDAMVDYRFFLLAVSSLFTIVNPFSTVPVFLAITEGETRNKRIKTARKASLAAVIVLAVFAVGGNYIMRFFGITIESFLIAGGIIVGVIGYQMMNSTREKLHSEKERAEAIGKGDVSIVPLAIPLLSGPGAITTSIVLMGQGGGFLGGVAVIATIIVVCALSFVVLANAELLERSIGEMGRRIIQRIMGLIVLVIGVQFIIDGVSLAVKSIG